MTSAPTADDIAAPPLLPSLRLLYFKLGRALVQHERYSEAVAAIEQALREAGDEPGLTHIERLLATARAAAGDTDGALDAALEALLNARPGEAPEIARQAEALIGAARLPMHRPLLCDPRWPTLVAESALPARARKDIGVLVGRALLQIGSPETAEPLLATAARFRTGDPEPSWLYGRVLVRLGRHEEAVTVLRAAQRKAADRGQDRTATEIAIELARALLAGGQVAAALGSLPDPAAEDPRLRARALQVRGIARLANGEAEAALTAVREAAELVPGDLDVLRVQAQALIALHRNEEALLPVDKGLERNPTDEDLQLLRLLAQVEGQTDPDSADGWEFSFRRLDREVLRACLHGPVWQGRDDDARAHYARAMLLSSLGDPPGTAAECRRALELGLGDGLPNEPEAPVYALLAESLDQQGDDEAATEAHFNAGQAYYFRGTFDQATQHLEIVVKRQPGHPRASWILAGSLIAQAAKLSATSAGDSGWDRQQALLASKAPLLERARQLWDRAAAVLPGQIEDWAYGLRAYINEECIPLQPQRRDQLLWAGITFAERGLLKARQNSYLWTALVHIYRMLQLDACFRAASDMALENIPDNVDILEERIIFFSNIGDFDSALEAIGKREAAIEKSVLEQAQRTVQTAWHLACRARAALDAGEYEEALDLVGRSLQPNDGDAWIKEIAGQAHRMLGDRDASRRVFTEILAARDTGEPDWETVADSYFALGQPDKALDAYQRLRLVTGDSHGNEELYVGLCQMLGGDIDLGRQTVENQIMRYANRDGIIQLHYGMRVIADEVEDKERRKTLGKVGAHLIDVAERRVQELALLPSDPDAELMSVLNSPPADDARAAAMAGLARRADEREDWEDAAAWYERLEAMREVFPEINAAFGNVADALEGRAHDRLDADGADAAAEVLESAITAGSRAGRSPSALAAMRQRFGDALVRHGDTVLARTQYANALGLLDDDEREAVIALRRRAAIASDLEGIPDPGRERLAAALRGPAAAAETGPGLTFGELARSLVGSLSAYARLDTSWASASDDPALPAGLRPALASARAALVRALDDMLGVNRIPEDLIPVTTPIVLELGDALTPIVDSRQDGGHFLFELMPAMRDRITATTGVTVPGVRARGNPAIGRDRFCIEIDEIPVVGEALDPEASFTVVPGVRPGGRLTDRRPSTSAPGIWTVLAADTSNDEGDQLTAADVLAHHIECVIRGNLHRYLGPQEVSHLVAGWAKRDEHLVAAVLPDDEAQLRLTWVLQALADDGVPLTDGEALLRGIRDAGGIGASPRVLYRALRLCFRDRLPGPSTGFRPVPVPAGHEAALGDNGSLTGRFEFRSWLRQYVATSGPAIALVTAGPAAREQASTLARGVHPLIKTLTREELRGSGAAGYAAASGPDGPDGP